MQHWERLEPEQPCVSPDGHSLIDVMTMGSVIPSRTLCRNCGLAGTIVVFDGPRPAEV